MMLFHGGVPFLQLGAIIEPGHERQSHDGCEFCAARAQSRAHLGVDGPSARADRVYCTTNRLYAKHYASLWGRGDLYRVEPVGSILRSDEDTIPSFHAGALRVVAVHDRAVLLTWSERRRLFREWSAADALAIA
jgi:hypothetical protein